MLISDPSLPQITVTISQLLYAFGISLNILGAILIFRAIRKKRNERK